MDQFVPHWLGQVAGSVTGLRNANCFSSRGGAEHNSRYSEKEVLPRVEAEVHVQLTHDPDGRATMGASSGGSAALAMTWYRPDLYHRVLLHSADFTNQQ
jgi:enterochelin esterase-like enzyme